MSAGWLTPEIEERLALRRRRAILVLLVVLSAFFIDDVVTGGALTGRLVAIRSLWLAFSVLVLVALERSAAHQRRLLLGLLGVGTALCYSAMALVRGDQHTPYFAFLLALPLCVVVVLQDEVAAVALNVLGTLVGACTILALSHAGTDEALRWMVSLSGSSLIAVYASFHQRRHLREEATQQQRLTASEAGRAEAERMALIGQLAAGVAHEINNPLAFVIANLAFLEGEFLTPTPDPEERVAVFAETQLGLKRIKAIVSDLTAFSRVSEEQTGEVDLLAIVHEAERLAAGRIKGRIGILNELPADLRRVIGNQRHLAQVFLNLILNAADARGATLQPAGTVWIRASATGDKLKVDVEDNGPGLPEGVLANLFQPFFTTKSPGQGTGLGLATSREYLRRAGGDLNASQRPGGGARFTLALRHAPRTPG